MNWLRKLLGKRELEPSGQGVLFGLDPPEGCRFSVTNHDDSSWHVRIVRRGEDLAHECELIGWWRHGGKKTDEELIRSAAVRALAAYENRHVAAERKRIVSNLEGCYPPKRTAHG